MDVVADDSRGMRGATAPIESCCDIDLFIACRRLDHYAVNVRSCLHEDAQVGPSDRTASPDAPSAFVVCPFPRYKKHMAAAQLIQPPKLTTTTSTITALDIVFKDEA